MKEFLLIIGMLLALFGVVLVYDARPITRKVFGFGDQNEASMGLKIFGFVITIIGAFIVYFHI